MTGHVHPPHLDDGDLVRLLDGELDPARAAGIHSHIDQCDDCARRWRRLEARSGALAGLLDASAAAMAPQDPPNADRDPDRLTTAPTPADLSAPPDRRPGAGEPTPTGAGGVPLRLGPRAREGGRSRGWWPIAAAIALVVAAGLLAPPVRAWVADRLEAVRPGPGDAAAGPSATVLRLPATGPALTVETEGMVADAVLVVERVPGDELTLEVTDPGATVVVIDGGFRLEGGAAGTTYSLSVPDAVDRIVLRPANEPGRSIVVPLAGATRIPLAPGRRERGRPGGSGSSDPSPSSTRDPPS